MRLEAVHRADDHGEECPTCGGAVHRRVYGEVYAGAFVLDGERVEIRRIPDEGYRDPVYLDELTQYFHGTLYRIWPSQKYFTRGGGYLHRDVWTVAFGPIPKGCHIHHRDGNIRNNRLDNLECIPKDEHQRLPRPGRRRKRLPDAALAAARDWHRSDEGRLWHSRMAKQVQGKAKRVRERRDCLNCGEPYDALVRRSGWEQKYCSTVCKAAAYRKRNAAV